MQFFFMQIAQLHGKADEENLLKLRKLVLLVDLDQTLVHTTQDSVDAKLPVNIIQFNIFVGQWARKGLINIWKW